jgi:hypothetical protein
MLLSKGNLAILPIEIIPYYTLTLNYIAVNSFHSDDSEKCRYFETVIWKKQIGIKLSTLYLNWADITRKVSGKAEAILVLQKVSSKQYICLIF